MKKQFLKTILLGALLSGASVFNKSFAQFDLANLSFGAGLGFTAQAGFGGSMAFNLRAHYLIDERSGVTAGVYTQFPVQDVTTVNAHALSSATVPANIDVSLTQRVAFQNLSVEYNRYLVGDAEEPFGMYGLLGAGITLATVKTTYSNYDRSSYSVGTEEEALQVVPGLVINAGLGGNYILSEQLALFGEVRLGIPAGNSYNSRGSSEINNPIPFNFGLMAGVRFSPFN